VNQILERVAKARRVDLDAWEAALRGAVLAAGGTMLGELIDGIGSGRRQEPVMCRCGARMHSRGRRYKELSTLLGPVPYWRSMFQCALCGATCYPGDEELDVVDTSYSPALRRIMARMGGKSAFKEASEDLRICAAVRVTAKAVERVAEAAGQDMEPRAPRGRGPLGKKRCAATSSKRSPQIRRYRRSMLKWTAPACP